MSALNVLCVMCTVDVTSGRGPAVCIPLFLSRLYLSLLASSTFPLITSLSLLLTLTFFLSTSVSLSLFHSLSLSLFLSLCLTLSLPPLVSSLFIFPFLLRHICMRLSTRSLMREPRPVPCYAQCTRTACSPQLRYVLTRQTLSHDDLSS